MYQAIHIEAMRDKIMTGLAKPTGGTDARRRWPATTTRRLEARLPYDLAAAQAS